MIYLGNPCGPRVKNAMSEGLIGMLHTPAQGNLLPEGTVWAADNGCFNAATYVGDDAWLGWLHKLREHAGRCLFATAPDVLADVEATLARAAPWLPRIRRAGYPAGLVAQDGLEDQAVPWGDFDALFIGGTTAWKLSPGPARLAGEAKARGKHVHMGRVNSGKRWRYAEYIGCDSVDGTYLVFGPKTNWPKLHGWVSQPALFNSDEVTV